MGRVSGMMVSERLTGHISSNFGHFVVSAPTSSRFGHCLLALLQIGPYAIQPVRLDKDIHDIVCFILFMRHLLSFRRRFTFPFRSRSRSRSRGWGGLSLGLRNNFPNVFLLFLVKDREVVFVELERVLEVVIRVIHLGTDGVLFPFC